MGLDIGGAARPSSNERPAPIDAIHSGGSAYWPIASRTEVGSEGDALRVAFETSRHATLVADAMGRIELANPAAAILLGRPRAELEGSVLLDWLTPIEHRSIARVGTPPTVPQSFGVRLPDGRTTSVWQRAVCDRWGAASQMCIEIEEPRDPPSAGIAALARLAGVLSHDLSNQLSAALNYVAVLERRTRRIADLAPHIAELHGTLWHTARLADELKLLARRPDPEAKSLRLDRVARELLPLLRHITGAANVEVASERGLPKVRAPLGYVEQLLCSVALSAMRRSTDPHARLIIRLQRMEDESARQPKVRVACEVAPPAACATRAAAAPERTLTRPSHHERLRQAVRTCGAQLSHDASSVYVDFPTNPCR